ncbi:MAG: flavin oxidoreductase/NADH oxidase [Clostridia bacterium]|nr:flavin oxidoreductase/NADH oxidase [Clostridia bacterium]
MFAYEKKDKNTYNFRSLSQLRSLIEKNGYDVPLSRDLSALRRTVDVNAGGKVYTLGNSLSVHPMEGFDGETDGSPSELSHRRYMRFAASGAALVWSEAIAVVPEGRTSDHQLMITEANVDKFASLVADFKKITDAPIIAQLTHSGRFSHNSMTPHPIIMQVNPEIEKVRPQDKGTPEAPDDYLDQLHAYYAKAAALAVRAGFDGVDIKICHQYLLSEALSAFLREGKYGGSYENRTRLIKDIFIAVKTVLPKDKILASRFGVSDMLPYPYGYGTDKTDAKKFDLGEAETLLSELMRDYGLSLIDMTMGSPYIAPHINRPYNKGGYVANEHPLVGVSRLMSAARQIKTALPDLTVVGTGLSYLREFSPYAAAGALEKGYCDLAGFGRMAFAYDTFASDMLAGKFDASKTCITCSKCTELMRHGSVTGCPIRDQEIYLPIYKKNVMGK